MAIPCNATEIADFVLLWGMSGTFPQYCNYAEDALDLKSLDLITSTVAVFVEAFWLKFEGIYRKYKMDIPLSEEKFIEFLKPRCLLLTKDDKCFNFMLVCAFVSEVIHSLFEYNKCFHLVKVASKCLAAILKNRFKRIFENDSGFKIDSGWIELMSFCIKIHDLIYPHAKKCKSNGNQSVGEVVARENNGKESGCRFPVTEKIDVSFPKFVQVLTDLSVEKYAADYNDDSDTEVSGKKCSTPLKKDLTIEKKGQKLKGLCDLEFRISTGTPHTLQLKDDDSSSKEESVDKEKTCDEKNASENNEKYSVIYLKDSSFPNFSHEVTEIVIYQSDEGAENFGQIKSLKKQLTTSFGKDLTVKKVPEKLDLCNLDPTSLADASAALQMKGEVSSLSEESADKEKVVDESNGRDGNKDYATDSLLPDLAHGLTKMSTEKKAINKIVQEKLDLCNCDPTSLADASVALRMKGELSSLSEESADKENVDDESNEKDGNKKDYATDSLLPDLAHEFTKMSTEKKAINTHLESAEKPGHMRVNVTKKLEDLCKLMFVSSADIPHALKLKDKECSSNDDLEENDEPFSLLCMTADQICSRITDNPQHLSEIMNLIEKCEVEIEPNLISAYESNILLTDNLDEDLNSLDISSDSDLTIFELGIKTIVFATNFQNMKMHPSVKRIFRKDNLSDDQSISKSSGDESSDEMSNGVAYEYGHEILTSENLLCSMCAGGMDKFFDACVTHFGTIWYWTHHLVTDLFSFEFHENSEGSDF